MTRFDADLLRQAPKLRYILQFGVGLEVRLGARMSADPKH
jgi:hypothetical protein